MTIEQLEKIKAEVDWKSLEERITDEIGYPVVLEVKIREGRSPFLQLESQELIEHAGVMAAPFRSVKIEDSGITFSNDKKLMMLIIGYRWETRSGGTNGCMLFRAHYLFEEKEWRIKY